MNNEHSKMTKAKPVIKIAKRILPASSAEAKPVPSIARLGNLYPIAGLMGKRVALQKKTGALYVGVMEDINSVEGWITFSDCTVHGINRSVHAGTVYMRFQKGNDEIAHVHLAAEEVAE